MENIESFRIHPDYFGCGIGSTLTQWAEERAGSMLGKAPAGARVTSGTVVLNKNPEAMNFLLSRGYRETRKFFRMAVELENMPAETVFPPGISISTYEKRGDLDEIIRCDENSFSDHWGYVKTSDAELLADWKHSIRTNPFHDPALWFTALNEGRVVGLCLCDNGTYRDGNIGYIVSLCVLKEYRKRGIAGALLKHSFAELYRRGRRKITLGVDSESLTGAVGLYEKVGMRAEQNITFLDKIIRDGENYRTESI